MINETNNETNIETGIDLFEVIGTAGEFGWNVDSHMQTPNHWEFEKGGHTASLAVYSDHTTSDVLRIFAMIYHFGDGRHFSLASGDERRGDMSMEQIAVKWFRGESPDTRIGTP